MYAIEFETNVESGTIKIPEKFIKKIGDKVKVIILNDEDNSVVTEKTEKYEIKKFKEIPDAIMNPVIIEDFKFYTREQLNAR